MPQPRIALVFNPQSQNGALGRRWPDLAPLFRRELGSFEELRTAGPGDATRLARQALESGAEVVIAIGGDGTINEVANGFFAGVRPIAPEAALGVIPFGTGGDFRRTVHLPLEPSRAARLIAARESHPIDVGHLTFTDHSGQEQQRIFVNVASFGISGLVDQYVNESSKRLGGRLSFLLATARAGIRYKNQRVRVLFDGERDGGRDLTINTVAVANGRFFGGGMKIAPDAEVDDGYFDVVAVGDFSKLDFLLQGRRIYSGTHLELEKVSVRRAQTIRAEPLEDEVVRLDVDGETPGVLPATFKLLPRALNLIGP